MLIPWRVFPKRQAFAAKKTTLQDHFTVHFSNFDILAVDEIQIAWHKLLGKGSWKEVRDKH